MVHRAGQGLGATQGQGCKGVAEDAAVSVSMRVASRSPLPRGCADGSAGVVLKCEHSLNGSAQRKCIGFGRNARQCASGFRRDALHSAAVTAVRKWKPDGIDGIHPEAVGACHPSSCFDREPPGGLARAVIELTAKIFPLRALYVPVTLPHHDERRLTESDAPGAFLQAAMANPCKNSLVGAMK